MNLPLRDTASAPAAPAAMTVMEAAAVPAIRDGVDMAKLVGRPHVFGRIKPLRHGFMVEPVANSSGTESAFRLIASQKPRLARGLQVID